MALKGMITRRDQRQQVPGECASHVSSEIRDCLSRIFLSFLALDENQS